jgi:MFS family permease
LALSGPRAATAAGIAIGTAVGYNIANVGPAAEVVSQAYGIRLATVGFLTTALFVTHLVMQIPGGRLVPARRPNPRGHRPRGDRVRQSRALITPSFPLGIVARLIVGLGTGVGFIAGSDYVRATVGTTTGQGLYGAAGVGGGGLAIAIVPLTTSALAWRAPFVTALVFAVAVLACLPFMQRTASAEHASTGGAR